MNNINRVTVITNGSIIPKEDDWEKMKGERIVISISDYGDFAKKRQILERTFKENNIKYILELKAFGVKNGGIEKQNKSTYCLQIEFERCGVLCHTILNGYCFIVLEALI